MECVAKIPRQLPDYLLAWVGEDLKQDSEAAVDEAGCVADANMPQKIVKMIEGIGFFDNGIVLEATQQPPP